MAVRSPGPFSWYAPHGAWCESIFWLDVVFS
jgi:hypothetical protein